MLCLFCDAHKGQKEYRVSLKASKMGNFATEPIKTFPRTAIRLHLFKI